MRLELGMRMLQLQSPVPPESEYTDPALYYEKKYKVRKELFKIPIEYVLASTTTLNRFFSDACGKTTALGALINDQLFINDNLNPSCIPIAALLIRLDNFKRDEMVTLLGGEDKVKGKNNQQLKYIIYRTVFGYADKKLHTDEFADLLQKFRQEEQFPKVVKTTVVKGIIEEKERQIQNIEPAALARLARQTKEKNEYYLEEQQAYNSAYQKNKWVRQSRALHTISQGNISEIKRLIDPWITQSEGVTYDIINDAVLSENMAGVLDFINTLEQVMQTHESIEVDELGGRLIYHIQRHFTDVLDKRPPLFFQEEGSSKVCKGYFTEAFLVGLKRRLREYVFQEIETMKLALAQTSMNRSSFQQDRELQTIATQYIHELTAPVEQTEKKFILVSTGQIANIVSVNIHSYLKDLEAAAIASTQEKRNLLALYQARALIEKAGASTDAIDGEIKTRIQQEHEQLKGKIQIPSNPRV